MPETLKCSGLTKIKVSLSRDSLGVSGPDSQASHPGTKVPPILFLRLPTGCPVLICMVKAVVSMFTSAQGGGRKGSEGKTNSFKANTVEVVHTFSVVSHSGD